MSSAGCAIDGCTKPFRAKGLCRKHYERLRLTGSAVLAPRPTLAERFWSRVQKTDGCWEWVGCRNADGYGAINLGVHGRSAPAHRVAYELLVGSIPAGLHLDHLCENPGCVNPEHLEPVTLAENNRRAAASRSRKRSASYA